MFLVYPPVEEHAIFVTTRVQDEVYALSSPDCAAMDRKECELVVANSSTYVGRTRPRPNTAALFQHQPAPTPSQPSPQFGPGMTFTRSSTAAAPLLMTQTLTGVLGLILNPTFIRLGRRR